jgi:hypothetical protein
MLMIFQNSSARDNKMSSRIKYISAYYTFFRGLSASDDLVHMGTSDPAF